MPTLSRPLGTLARRTALVGAALAATAAPVQAAASPAVDARERAVIDRINQVRSQHGLGPLRLDSKISSSASRHSQRMQSRRTLSHQLPGEASLSQRLNWAVGSASTAEVIAWRSRGARSSQLVRAWMDSPGHRTVLLSSRYRSAGIGIATGSGGVYATVDVATR